MKQARGRLNRFERVEIIQRIATAMVEQGETRMNRLAEIAGVSRRRIAKLVEAARDLIRNESDEPLPAIRTKFGSRLDHIYRESLESYTACKAKGQDRNAAEFLKIAGEAVAKSAKIYGLETAAIGGQTGFKVTIEANGLPPAAIERITRLQAESGARSVSQLAGAVPSLGDGGSSGQNDGLAPRTLEAEPNARERTATE